MATIEPNHIADVPQGVNAAEDVYEGHASHAEKVDAVRDNTAEGVNAGLGNSADIVDEAQANGAEDVDLGRDNAAAEDDAERDIDPEDNDTGHASPAEGVDVGHASPAEVVDEAQSDDAEDVDLGDDSAAEDDDAELDIDAEVVNANEMHLLPKMCWVCLRDETVPPHDWIAPCRCTSMHKWVHESCLLHMVDENQIIVIADMIECTRCHMRYKLFVPEDPFIWRCIRKIERFVTIVAIGGAGVISCYWVFYTLGVYTIMQVMGAKKGLEFIQRHPWDVMHTFLPLISINLFAIEYVYDRIQYYIPRLHFHMDATHIGIGLGLPHRVRQQQGPTNRLMRMGRMVGNAIILPWISKLLGNMFFRVEDPVAKSMLGALSYFTIRAAFGLLPLDAV